MPTPRLGVVLRRDGTDKKMDAAEKSAIVLGAGMVGVSVGIHLLKRGWRVTLVDRSEPGSETSFGNAGVISRGSILPVSYPGLLWDIPKILAGRSRAVRVDPKAWLSMLGWAPTFLRSATKAENRRISRALNALLAACLEEHEALMQEAGATVHLTRAGWLKVYRTEAGFAATAFERDVMDELGVAYRVLDAEEIAALEPNLQPIYVRGVHILDTASVDDPGGVCRAYAALFEKLGGLVHKGEAVRLEDGGGAAGVRLRDGNALQADAVVVALGPWSGEVLKSVGVALPLFHERGYHRHYRAAGNAALSRPVNDTEGAFVLAPMAAGIRLTCGVEIAPEEAGPSRKLIEGVTPLAQQAFPLAEALDPEPWLGRRPSLPDSMPAIGRAPGQKRIWACFGHQHIGFTLGPVSGRLLAEMMSGEDPIVDPRPYDPSRFG